MNRSTTIEKWAVPILLVIMLAVNYLSATGMILPYTQAEISDKYLNLFAPAGFTFSIWSVIYLGVLATASIDLFKSETDSFANGYRQLIRPLFFQVLLYNILWTLAWNNDWVLVALLIIALYARTMIQMMKAISGNALLRQSPWLLKYPVGLHTGWLLVATLANLVTFAVSQGINGVDEVAVWWTIAVMVVAVGIAAYYYAVYGNQAVMLPTIWAVFGIIMKHQEQSDFEFSSPIIYWAGILIAAAAIALYIYLFFTQYKQNKKI